MPNFSFDRLGVSCDMWVAENRCGIGKVDAMLGDVDFPLIFIPLELQTAPQPV